MISDHGHKCPVCNISQDCFYPECNRPYREKCTDCFLYESAMNELLQPSVEKWNKS